MLKVDIAGSVKFAMPGSRTIAVSLVAGRLFLLVAGTLGTDKIKEGVEEGSERVQVPPLLVLAMCIFQIQVNSHSRTVLQPESR